MLVMTFAVAPVRACIYDSETGGEANTSVEFGVPYQLVGTYSPHTLRLGTTCISLGIATARGSMYVRGMATRNGPVTAVATWYMKGTLLAPFIGVGGITNDAWITVMFKAYDSTEGIWYETVLLHEHANPITGNTYEGEYWGTMTVPLYKNHGFDFVLDFEVHAEAIGVLVEGVADFGGVFWEDSCIEWRSIYVPDTYPPITLTVDARDQDGYMAPTEVWIDGARVGEPWTVRQIELPPGEHTIEVEEVMYVGPHFPCMKYSFQHWSDGVYDNPRTINLQYSMTYTALYYSRIAYGKKL